MKGHVEPMRLLNTVSNGAMKTMKDSRGNTALHYTAKNNHEKVQKLLPAVEPSSGGTKCNLCSATTESLQLPLPLLKATEFLLNIKCDPAIRNNDGEMPIHMAAREAAFASLYLLCVAVPLRERHNEKNKHGKTPVMAPAVHPIHHHAKPIIIPSSLSRLLCLAHCGHRPCFVMYAQLDCCTTHAARDMVAAQEPKKVASNEQHANELDPADVARAERRAADEKRGVAKRGFASAAKRAPHDDYEDYM